MGESVIDSLIANEFAFEIEGEKVDGIFRIEGLTTYATDADGVRTKPPFEVVKMVQRDGNNTFNKWLRATIDARDTDETPTRDVTVVAVDDGIETRRWTAKGAYISGVRYSAFDSGSFEMVAETFTIQYEDIEEAWSATGELE